MIYNKTVRSTLVLLAMSGMVTACGSNGSNAPAVDPALDVATDAVSGTELQRATVEVVSVTDASGNAVVVSEAGAVSALASATHAVVTQEGDRMMIDLGTVESSIVKFSTAADYSDVQVQGDMPITAASVTAENNMISSMAVRVSEEGSELEVIIAFGQEQTTGQDQGEKGQDQGQEQNKGGQEQTPDKGQDQTDDKGQDQGEGKGQEQMPDNKGQDQGQDQGKGEMKGQDQGKTGQDQGEGKGQDQGKTGQDQGKGETKGQDQGKTGQDQGKGETKGQDQGKAGQDQGQDQGKGETKGQDQGKTGQDQGKGETKGQDQGKTGQDQGKGQEQKNGGQQQK